MANAQIEAIRTLLAENPVVAPGASLEDMRKGIDAMGDMAPRLDNVTFEAVDAGGVDAEWFSVSGGDADRGLQSFDGGSRRLGSHRR